MTADEDRLQNRSVKRIFLTGASSGIGLAIARSLVGKGHEVWGTSRDTSRIPPLANLHPIQLDLADPDSITAAFDAALAQAGHFDIVINNAGSGHFGPAESLSREEIVSQFQVLVFGQVQVMRLALNAMRQRGEGLIINITSLASRLPVPFMAAYNAAKAALAVFTMTIQIELPGSRIHIVDLQPGDICTEFNDAVNKGRSEPGYDDKLAKAWDTVEHNMKNAPKPELVAQRICDLIDRPDPPFRTTVGDAFQTRIAPFIFRFLPQQVRLWGLKKYYGI